MVWGESACRNDAVDVGMREQVLSPGVKRADYADFGAQVFGIGGDFDDGLSAGSEQEIIEQTCVLQSQHVEFMGHSEHDMEIAGGQKFALPGRQPALAGLRLAVGAVAISARVIRDGLITAERALIAVTTPGQRYGSTVPGRKTDVSDCQWLQYLHSVGLLRASFRPPGFICAIRSLWR